MNQYDKRHLINIKRYQRRIDNIYKKAAEEAAMRSAGLTAPEDGIFSFDDFPATKKKIDALMETMRADIELTVIDGVRTEWALANAKNDALVDAALGQGAELAKYHRTHADALDAFINRKRGGLNLSDNVWNYTNQFKSEIEMALDCGIRDGLDAPAMARQLKKYLKHPDMLFRRIRDERGVLHLSKRAAAFHPGQGVYRSSYKNARRLAATETNIAYRTSDYERWKDMDFVVGIEVHLSNNHTCLNEKGEPAGFFDICDELKGKYPKDFKFTGWHPQCRCIAVPILKTKEERDADDERILRGQEPTDPDTSENAVKEMPDNFNKWMENNAERLESAKSMPYFIRDNFKDGDPSKGLRWVDEKKPTPAEIRHAARTPEKEQAIRDAWNKRKRENRLIELGAKNMLKVAADYGEVDTSVLQGMIGNVANMNVLRAETRKLAQQVLTIKKQEQALADLIPDVHMWHQQFTMTELQAVYSAVENKLAQWSALTFEQQAKKLSFEAVDFLGGNMNGVQQKYPTWKVSQSAYLKQLDKVNYKIAVQQVNQELQTIEQWSIAHPKSQKVASLLADAKQAVANGEDIATIKNKAKLAEIEHKKRLAEQSRRDRKKIGKVTDARFNAADYTQQAKDRAIWLKSANESHALWDADSEAVWNGASSGEQAAWRAYTSGSGHMNRPMRGYNMGWRWRNYRGVGNVPLDNEGGEKHIRDLFNLCERSRFTTNRWIQRGIETWDGVEGFFGIQGLTKDQLKTMVGKEVVDNAFLSCGSAKGTGFNGTILNIYCPKGTKGFYASPHSAYYSENETILQAGTKFRVTKVEVTPYGQVYVDLDVVGYTTHPLL